MENKYLYSLEHRLLMLLIKKKIFYFFVYAPSPVTPSQTSLVLCCPLPYTPWSSSCLSHSLRTTEEFSSFRNFLHELPSPVTRNF